MDDSGWIDASKIKPTQADADAQNCVLAWHCYNGCMLIGWWQFEKNKLLVYWQRCPRPPSEYRELWEKK